MNPIYKFTLTIGSDVYNVRPIYRDDLAKDFTKQSGEQFFRAALTGKLTFVGEDYNLIEQQAFDTLYNIKLYISYDNGQNWAEYWNGQFWKTDCTFDADNENVTLTPSVIDQYTEVLAGLEKEYNLVDLAPSIVPVKADKRPLLQVYVPGQTVIGCFLSGMWWEQECDSVTSGLALIQNYHFAEATHFRVLRITQGDDGSPELPALSVIEGGNYDDDFAFGDYKLHIERWYDDGYLVERTEIIRVSDDTILWRGEQVNAPRYLPFTDTLAPTGQGGATGFITIEYSARFIYTRYLCDVESWDGQSTAAIPSPDMTANNSNYRRVIAKSAEDFIFNTDLSSEPTPWGIFQTGQYYVAPQPAQGMVFPVARNSWDELSLWFNPAAALWDIEAQGRAPFTLRDAYPIAGVISAFLKKIAPAIKHFGTTEYSQFLYGANPITHNHQQLSLTPKSNLIYSGYDQPAQKAPLTLRSVLDMLRDCFRCFWFIDDQSRLRIEHISYFMRGGSYSDSPAIGRNLLTEYVSRNGKEWAFGTSKYQFDKPEMASRYQFGWMDEVTQPFTGYPIQILSKYVNPDNIEQISISKFTSDIDYILLEPGEVSKEGFALLASVIDNMITPPSSAYNLRPRYPFYQNVNWTAGDKIYIDFMINGTAGRRIFVSFMASDNTVIQTIGIYILTGSVQNIYIGPIEVPQNAAKIGIVILAGTASLYCNSISKGYYLPYSAIDGAVLQNYMVAFTYLQQFYAYDMPAKNYEINNVQMVALGMKRMKTQTLKFPAYTDPNLLQLVKTNLGDGTIEKLTLTLSSRNASATLKYDTE